MILKSTLYLTSDRSIVVGEGDNRAAFLLGRAGQVIPDDVARRYGIFEVIESLETRDAEVVSEFVKTRDPEPENRESGSRKVKVKTKK